MNKKLILGIVCMLTSLLSNAKPTSLMHIFIRSIFEGATSASVGIALEDRGQRDQSFFAKLTQEPEMQLALARQRGAQVVSIAALLNGIDAYFTSRQENQSWQDYCKSIGEVVTRLTGTALGLYMGVLLWGEKSLELALAYKPVDY